MRSLIEPPGFMYLELQEQLARPGVEAVQLQHRRVADHFEAFWIDVHGDSGEGLRRAPESRASARRSDTL